MDQLRAGTGQGAAQAGAPAGTAGGAEGGPMARFGASALWTMSLVAAILHLAQEVFVPLAVAMLITFALSPLVSMLRRRGLPMLVAVLLVVLMAFSAISAFSLVVAGQLADLATNLPTFQSNILAKVDALRTAEDQGGVAARLSDMIAAISSEIGSAMATDGAEATRPMQVEVVEPTNVIDVVNTLVLPLVSPVATAGLVVVVVIFMLLEREGVRDRFIRLLGSNDLHRSTQVLEEAGARVGTYLLIQLLVNVIYAIPIGLGLWFIGVPNAILWGLLTLVLRFVPYIGSILAAAFPLFLAFAVSPDWSAVLWTAALFGIVELLTSNVVEPWAYGSRTGVSPLAIIVAAIFWTFLWGPVGLVLSTPLTVCLVVLGRHIPQFALFEILFGDEPVLAPHARLYQRLLAGDATEATFDAEEAVEDMALADYYHQTVIPALLRAQDDRDRGVLTAEQEDRLGRVAMHMVTELSAVVEEERLTALADAAEAADAPPPAEGDLPGDGAEPAFVPMSGTGSVVVTVGGRSALDDVAARMLAQLLQVDGAEATASAHTDLAAARVGGLGTATADCLILCFVDPTPARASLLHVRRLKRAAPALRVGVVIFAMPADAGPTLEGMPPMTPVSAQKLAEIDGIGADFVVTDLDAAIEAALRRTPPRPLPDTARQSPRRSTRSRRKPAAGTPS